MVSNTPLTESGDVSRLGMPIESLPASSPLPEILASFERDGALCLRDAIDSDSVARINDLLDPIMEETHLGLKDADDLAKSVLGMRSKRRSDVLALDPEGLEPFVAHPRVLELAEATLGKHCTTLLLHQAQANELHPGELSQVFHRDAGSLWPIPGIRFHQNLTVIVALKDFTAETGGTCFLLGSHRWPEAVFYDPEKEGGWKRYQRLPRLPEPEEVTTVEMSPGSILLVSGDVFHGAGANTTTDRPRRTVSAGYSLGWLRGEVNQQLMWPPEVAKKFPPVIQRLVGYQVENHIIGCLEMGQDPITLLEN